MPRTRGQGNKSTIWRKNKKNNEKKKKRFRALSKRCPKLQLLSWFQKNRECQLKLWILH